MIDGFITTLVGQLPTYAGLDVAVHIAIHVVSILTPTHSKATAHSNATVVNPSHFFYWYNS